MKTPKSYPGYRVLLLGLPLSILLAACGGGHTGPNPLLGGGGDNVALAPMVTATTPNATTPILNGIPINSKITATFSTDMAANSLTSANFTVACPTATKITGAVNYVAASRTAVFAPLANLPSATTCTVMLSTGIKDLAGDGLSNAYTWSFTTAATANVTPPKALSNAPTGAGVALNTKVSVTFNEDMDPSSITSSSFTLTGPGLTAVTGSVSYAVGARSATFTPTKPAPLVANTLYTATLTTAALDLAGNHLASDFVWTFTTGVSSNVTPPTVTLVNPAALSVSNCLQKSINATFSTAMDPQTITTTTFTLQNSGPPLGKLLAGIVTYDTSSQVATFQPNSALLANSGYTATVTLGAKDLAGNGLAKAYVWSFHTGAQNCALVAPVALGTAAPFGDLGGTAGTTNTGILTVIGGDVSSTATVTSALTGLHDSTGDIYTETGSNQGTVEGKIYSCTVSTIGPTSAAVNPTSCNIATQARTDAQAAYNKLTPAQLPGGTDPGAGQLGGLTLAPGVYQAANGSFMLTGSDLTLDGHGDAKAVWVFQTASTLTVGGPGAPRSIILINGAKAANVFWQVGTSATINAAGGGTMVGTILASSAVSFSTVGNVAIVTLNGRAMGLNASVTMTNTVVNIPAP